MNNNLPLVSIVVASYNNGQYLEECLESAVNQTYQNIEIIIADDCSTDNSREIIGKFIVKYPDKKIVPVFNEKNMGACNSVNNAIFNYCSGEWIKFLDSDDYLYDFSVECMIEESYLFKNLDCIYGLASVLDNNSMVGNFGSKYSKILLLNGHNMIPTCSSMIMTSSFIELGGFPKNGYVGDLYLWLGLTLLDKNFLFIPKAVSVYRKHSSASSMMTNKISMIMSQAEIFLHLSRKYNKYQSICIKTAVGFLNASIYLNLIELSRKSIFKGLLFYFKNFFNIFRYSEKKSIMFIPNLLMRRL